MRKVCVRPKRSLHIALEVRSSDVRLFNCSMALTATASKLACLGTAPVGSEPGMSSKLTPIFLCEVESVAERR